MGIGWTFALAFAACVSALAIILAVRETRVSRMPARALRAANPRRSRALARIFARAAGPRQREQLAIVEATGLLWEGAFERAIALLHSRVVAAKAEAAPLVIELQCLLFAERPEEAKALFARHHDALRSARRWRGDVAAIAAFLRFHAGDLDGARSDLAEALRLSSSHAPVKRAIHMCLAEIAHRQGREDETRLQLEHTIRHGGDLFIVEWARAQRQRLFPSDVRIALVRARRAPPFLLLRGLGRNLQIGLGVLFFRAAALRARVFTIDQVVALVLLDLAIVVGLRLTTYRSGAHFFGTHVFTLTAPFLFFVLTAYVAAPRAIRRDVMFRLLAGFYAALPPVLVVVFVAIRMQPAFAPGPVMTEWVAGAWLLAVVVRMVHAIAPRAGLSRTFAAAVVFTLTWLVPMFAVARSVLFFGPLTEHQAHEAEQTRHDELVFAQADLVRDAEGWLAPERPGVTDLYFVGAAGWADQDVFGREVLFARSTMDERFDTRGRSLLLANDPSTRGVLPLVATPTLRHALRAVGMRMNREEDVVFLFVTSHGSTKGLALRPPRDGAFDDETLTPQTLRSMLDSAGIKWRVLVVSGCESGVFIEPLANEFTLIATAAADDRNSYGCATGNAFTDFGRAVFSEQLYVERSFPRAFANAARAIDKREVEADLRTSRPQVFEGSSIGAKLRQFEERLAVESAK